MNCSTPSTKQSILDYHLLMQRTALFKDDDVLYNIHRQAYILLDGDKTYGKTHQLSKGETQ